ncbi:tetrahydrofolate dehydrogenase/cyclohydrolase catalytic domain-containing protein, partial [Buchnera aphidicola]|uniref:tetrahydrofolate dehydrogenase/cyclohydrolase catalytic domain-containing protein n=1 Tax=Buchnera aphidicola TaxID=9 RepID=UPI00263B0F01
MSAIIIDGNKIANKIQSNILKRVNQRKKNGKKIPGLAMILIGTNIPSQIYVNKKKIACKNVGFFSECWTFPDNVNEVEVLNLINKLNNNKKIDGILIQLPLPKHINQVKILHSIDPKKDVDGFHPYNTGSLCQRTPRLRACTPRGIIAMLKYNNIQTYGLNAVMV